MCACNYDGLCGLWCLCYDIQLTPGGYHVNEQPKRQGEVEMDTGFTTGYCSLVDHFSIKLSSIEPYGYLQLPVRKIFLVQLHNSRCYVQTAVTYMYTSQGSNYTHLKS